MLDCIRNGTAERNGTALLLLHNLHRFLNNPEVIQTTICQLVAGKQQRTFIVVLSPVVQIPVEPEKLFVVLDHAFVAEFARLVSHLTERLSDGDGERRIFRDSVVTNLGEFFQRFRQLNVRSNEDLDGLVVQAQQLVGGVTPQDLRDNAGLRQHVAAEMAVVQSRLEGMIVDRPRRQIIRSNPARNGDNHAPGH